VVAIQMKNVLNASLLFSPISKENQFPRVHLSVQDQVLPLHCTSCSCKIMIS
jgi:hypothetical protein